jgi:DNA-binding NtrC family response regulator
MGLCSYFQAISRKTIAIFTVLSILVPLVNESYFIFFSADYSIKDKALALGAKYFLEKPFQLDKLSNIIEKIISEN